MKQKYFLYLFLFLPSLIHGYGLPPVNLGLYTFLEGGPLRPQPGFYWQEFLVYYSSHNFLNANGDPLGDVPSPHWRNLTALTQLIYQFDNNVLGAEPGISASLSTTLYSHISSNELGFADSGSGIGDLIVGPYLQWPAIKWHDRPLLIQRLELNIKIPTGKNKAPEKNINPGSNIVALNPYWASTFYFTPHWAASWRTSYLWCSTNHATHLKAGDAFHMNFTTEYEVRPHWWLGFNGYYLRQLKNNTLNGAPVADSKEQVLGLGAGFLYATSERYNTNFFGNVYYECNVRNRPQGITALIRFFKYFD